MSTKRFPEEFKVEAVKQITERGGSTLISGTHIKTGTADFHKARPSLPHEAARFVVDLHHPPIN